MPKLMALQVVGGQFAHLRQESQIALLDLRRGLAPLENLDQPDRLQVGSQRGDHQEEIGRIARLAFAEPRVRRHQDPFAAGEGLVDQLAVPLLILFVLRQVGLLDVDLILEGEWTPVSGGPDRPSDRGQGGHHPIEKLAVELAGGDVLFRQLGDLAHQRLNLPLRLFDELRIDGFFITAHSAT